MNKTKMSGYVLYAVGIIGGVESAVGITDRAVSTATAITALAAIIAASYLLQK